MQDWNSKLEFKDDGYVSLRAYIPRSWQGDMGCKEIKRSMGRMSVSEARFRQGNFLSQIIYEKLAEKGLSPTAHVPYVPVIQEHIQQAASVAQLLTSLLTVNTTSSPAINQVPVQVVHQPEKPKGMKLGTLIEKFLREKKQRAKSRSIKSYIAKLRFLSDYFGNDRDVTTINRDEVNQFREDLLLIPVNYTKTFGSLSFRKYLDEEEYEIYRDSLLGISDSTINSYYARYTDLFNWAERQDYIIKSRFNGFGKYASRGPRNPTYPYSVDQLNELLACPALAGHKDRYNIRWIWVLLLFSGARLGEICQLTGKDIFRDEEGQYYLSINRDLVEDPILRKHGLKEYRKTTKNLASIRIIPVHRTPTEVGFEQFVEDKIEKYGDGFIFPNFLKGLSQAKAEEKDLADNDDDFQASYHYSKKMLRIIKSCEFGPGLKVHSFRHTLKTCFSEYEIPGEAQNKLGGWSTGSKINPTAAKYGVGASEKKLAEIMNRIDYPGLELPYMQDWEEET